MLYICIQSFVLKMKALHGTCPTCLSDIDEEKVTELIEEKTAEAEIAAVETMSYTQKIVQIKQQKTAWQEAQKSQEDWEKSLPSSLHFGPDLNNLIYSLQCFLPMHNTLLEFLNIF